MDREVYINRYVKMLLERWRVNVEKTLGQKYVDRPENVMHILALSIAESSWEMETNNRKYDG